MKLAAALCVALCACSQPAREVPQVSPPPDAAPPPVAVVDAGAVAPIETVDEREERELVESTLRRVSQIRGLPIQKMVPIKTLSREAILARIKEHVVKEVPLEVVALEGEPYAALGVVPARFDFVEGSFRLIQGRIAGYYEPEDGTMYLVDDLGTGAEADETLAHELTHALQDQSFPLAPMIKYTPGDNDRIAAAHAVVEGDAVSAMLEVVHGSAFDFPEAALREAFVLSTRLSLVGFVTPKIIQASLVAPYADGFDFVQALRREAKDQSWSRVNEALRRPPTSTEQLLHVDKYEKNEPPLSVPTPAIAPLGDGWSEALDDVMGEQGVEILFEQWSDRERSQKAAAGWGGDRYVVARRDLPAEGARPAGHAFAVAWRLRFDSPAEAAEAVALLRERVPACAMRADLGPLAWKSSRSEIVFVGGPYVRIAKDDVRGLGSCAAAVKWATAVLSSPP